jgi:hypothetical protein
VFNRDLFQESQPIYVSDMGMFGASLVCRSSDGGYWIYHPSSMRAIHFNDQLSETKQGTSMQVIFSGNAEPVSMKEAEKWLVMAVPGKGLVLFDNYGTYYKTFSEWENGDFTIYKGKIVFLKNGFLTSLDIKTGKLTAIPLPIQEFNTVYLSIPGWILIRHEDNVNAYTY